MKAEERRKELIKRLQGETGPLSASRLAQEFGVSRQVIVQDVAIIRASGVGITALSKGYVLDRVGAARRVFKLHHSDEDVEKELNLIVDAGGTVLDVFVFHKVYGTVRAELGISSRLHVKQFLQDIAKGKSSLLKNVTAGYHYHTVSADSEETLDIIEQRLCENGFVAPLQAFEPSGLQK